jgi:Carbohydrate family 9 binding domain-like/Domain of unknown function (DUF5916)
LRLSASGIAGGAMLLMPVLAFAAQSAPADGAAQQPEPPARDFSTYIPTGRATKIEATEAPAIDGDLGDPIWEKAQAIDEFYQLEPNTGRLGSERTVLRFLYDQNNLYVGIYAYDREPDQIRATNMSRDGGQGSEDNLQLFLDPLNTRRNSYYFSLNALGARNDALIQNNTDYIREWNTIWRGKAKKVADGFTAEMAIPFRDLAYDPAKPDWVVEFSRDIRRRGERIRWGAINPATYFADITRSGTITGITGIQTGIGLDVQLFGSARYRFNYLNPEREIISFRTSGNAFYKLTPQLTGTLTFNPDFSDAPLDELQVNTTRFALFQPETRNFFLQDTSTFEFGGRNFTTTFNYPYRQDNGMPFFSRNIGLVAGRPASIVGGTKLSGEWNGLGIGMLSAVTNGTGVNKRNQVLSVARVTKVIGESKAGLMFTNGDPTGLSENTLAGADFQYRDSNFLPGKILQGDFYYQRTFSSTRGDGDSFGAALNLPNEPFGAEARFRQIAANFFPALGFLNRPGIRVSDGRLQYRKRGGLFRWFDAGGQWFAAGGLDNKLQSLEAGPYAGVALRSTDEIYSRVLFNYENISREFRIAGRIPVPVGVYQWANINPFFRTNQALPVFFRGDFLCCSFYNGHYFRGDIEANWRPNPYIQFQPRYIYTYVSLPGGRVDIHQITANFIVNITPDMQIFNQFQYDNISERIVFSLRYRWEYQPGQELFASIGQFGSVPGEAAFIPGTYVPTSTQATIRLGRTFRF